PATPKFIGGNRRTITRYSSPSTSPRQRMAADRRPGRQELAAGIGPHCQWQKKTPHRGRMRGLIGYPSSLLDGERRRQGLAKRPPLPAEMSDAFKCHIECDDCLLDPRLIDPDFSAMGRPAIGESTGAPELGARPAPRWAGLLRLPGRFPAAMAGEAL